LPERAVQCALLRPPPSNVPPEPRAGLGMPRADFSPGADDPARQVRVSRDRNDAQPLVQSRPADGLLARIAGRSSTDSMPFSHPIDAQSGNVVLLPARAWNRPGTCRSSALRSGARATPVRVTCRSGSDVTAPHVGAQNTFATRRREPRTPARAAARGGRSQLITQPAQSPAALRVDGIQPSGCLLWFNFYNSFGARPRSRVTRRARLDVRALHVARSAPDRCRTPHPPPPPLDEGGARVALSSDTPRSRARPANTSPGLCE
jgi:hypothetical protein